MSKQLWVVLKIISGIFFVAYSSWALSVELYENFPRNIQPDEQYVFYSHGLIVEGANPKPVHPEFGTYEFPEIAQEIYKDGGFNLIAHHRPAGTDPDEYSDTLVDWVNRLVDSGVQPGNITLIGFSRGAQITLKTSNQLAQIGINTAVMGVCFDGDFPSDPEIELTGRILSIYETSDVVKSCSAILDRSDNAESTNEIAISTGQRHGAFYTPRPEWIVPLKAWLSNNGR
jgi:hypothetical protein